MGREIRKVPPEWEHQKAEAHRQLTLLGISLYNPDTKQPLTLEQRLRLCEQEVAAAKKEKKEVPKS
jgi:hypothetical protein